MSLKDILYISGLSGLQRFVSQGRTAVIVESLATGKRLATPMTGKMNLLEDISVFADSGDVPLREVFQRIKDKEAGGAALSAKAPEKELREYFAAVLPDYDRRQVYLSDIRKVLAWYNELQGLGMTDFAPDDDTAAETGDETTESK
jgi:hypothetical protein